MGKYIVSRVINDGSLYGIGIVDSGTFCFRVLPLWLLYDTYYLDKNEVRNIRITDNKLVGLNGDIDRYAKIDMQGSLIGKGTLTIINEILYNNNRPNGDRVYTVSNYRGDIHFIGATRIISLLGIGYTLSNGRVLNTKQGYVISPIRGKYDTKDISEVPEGVIELGDWQYSINVHLINRKETDNNEEVMQLVIKRYIRYKESYSLCYNDKVIFSISDYEKRLLIKEIHSDGYNHDIAYNIMEEYLDCSMRRKEINRTRLIDMSRSKFTRAEGL